MAIVLRQALLTLRMDAEQVAFITYLRPYMVAIKHTASEVGTLQKQGGASEVAVILHWPAF